MSEFFTHFLESAEPLIALLLTVGTFGLWWSTARMNHIEKMKSTEALSRDNDNMTEVALAEIEAHHHNDNVRKLKRVSRRNRKGGIL